MRQANSPPAASEWAWNAENSSAPEPPQRGPSPSGRGLVGAVLAGVVFLSVVSLAVGAYVLQSSDDVEDRVAGTEEPDIATARAPAASNDPAKPASVEPGASLSKARPPSAAKKRAALSLNQIAWTTDAPSTLEDLGRAWSIPRDVLATLNPGLPAEQQLEAGVEVIVHTQTLGASFSVGPPNNGRLSGGVPLPEGEAWALPADRSRAFATAETIAALSVGLEAYAQRFPGAEPIQIGDLSARRGGEISGHQSHQSGRDVDIRLVIDSTGDAFDPDRNWFLVKTLIDDGDVRAVFLNRTEQTWLRSAAEADVGTVSAAEYFALIRHERGHTIHTHVRFACPQQSKRCVAYPLPDAEEDDPKKASKLPSQGGIPTVGKPKLPGKPLKGGGKAPVKKKKGKKKKKKKKGGGKGKKKKGS